MTRCEQLGGWPREQYQRAMYVPAGVLRSYVPCRAKPQPPSGCNGQCSRLAERQSSRVTYSSPASPESNRSCTGTGPVRLLSGRAHLLKAHYAKPASPKATWLLHAPAAHGNRSTRAHPRPSTQPRAVDMWTMRWRSPARRVDAGACPPPVPSPTCPPPPTTVRSRDPVQRQCHRALRHRLWASGGHTLRQEQCGESRRILAANNQSCSLRFAKFHSSVARVSCWVQNNRAISAPWAFIYIHGCWHRRSSS